MNLFVRCLLTVSTLPLALSPSIARPQPPATLTSPVPLTIASSPLPQPPAAAGTASTETDNAGVASLRLPRGAYVIVATRIGFEPDSISLVLNADTLVTLDLVRQEEGLEPMIISATRTERRIEQTPLRVEVLA